MTGPIDMAAMRKRLRPDSPVIETSAPCDSESADESSVVQVGRQAARAELFQWEHLATTLLEALEAHQFPTGPYRATLAEEQPMIDEYYTLIPEATHPYSPRMSESQAVLTKAQFATCCQTVTNLKALAECLSTVARLVMRIKQTRQSLNTLRNVAPRQLTASDLHGTAAVLQPAVEVAADPQGQIARADTLLDQAHTAVVEERFGDAEQLLEQALLVPGLLRIVPTAEACGALVAKDKEQAAS